MFSVHCAYRLIDAIEKAFLNNARNNPRFMRNSGVGMFKKRGGVTCEHDFLFQERNKMFV